MISAEKLLANWKKLGKREEKKEEEKKEVRSK